jgi:large subunit ribosomal protein L1
MQKRSKRYRAALALFDRATSYSLADAVNIVKKVATDDKSKVKFDQTINMSVNLDLKSKHTVRDTATLPFPISKERRILVFARGEKAEEAKSAGASFVGDDELIEKIKGGWVDFDVAISTPDLMREVGKLGAVLGRRGLMPNPKTGTVTNDVSAAIADFKKGKTEFRADKGGNVNIGVSRASFSAEQTLANVELLYSEIMKKRPSDLKGDYVTSVTLAPCMGPGIRIIPSTIGQKKRG